MTNEVGPSEVNPDLERKRAQMAKAREAKAAKLAAQKDVNARPPEPDNEDTRTKRARLIEELAALPPEPQPVGRAPGSIVTDGLGPTKVDWTAAVLRQYCNEGRVVDGVKFEWKEYTPPKNATVSWNGITYALWGGYPNKIPSVHYTVIMTSLEDARRDSARFAPPANPIRAAGYYSEPHLMGTGPLEARSDDEKTE
jgi:hypothetical protein